MSTKSHQLTDPRDIFNAKISEMTGEAFIVVHPVATDDFLNPLEGAKLWMPSFPKNENALRRD